VYLLAGVIYEALTGGEFLEEVEHVGHYFAHELPDFSIARYVKDERVEMVNGVLRGMFRRDPDLRISATNVVRLCEAILEWRPGRPTPRVEPAMSEAEEAAAEYRLRSEDMRDEVIRQELERTCDRVADHFGSRQWAQRNQVTKMIDKNWGDTEPLQAMKQRYPGSVWMAVRVLVAFETQSARPMFMSYVFIGRLSPDKEIVGVINEDKQWQLLSESAPNDPRHVQVMIDATSSEQGRLLKKLAPTSRALR